MIQSRTGGIKSTKRKNSNGSSMNESIDQNESKHVICNSNSLLNINNYTKSSRSNNQDSLVSQMNITKSNMNMIPLPISNKHVNSDNGFDVIRSKTMNQNFVDDRIKIKKNETNITPGNKTSSALQKDIKVESTINQKDNKGIHINFN